MSGAFPLLLICAFVEWTRCYVEVKCNEPFWDSGYSWEVAADPLTPCFIACTEFWCKQNKPKNSQMSKRRQGVYSAVCRSYACRIHASKFGVFLGAPRQLKKL